MHSRIHIHSTNPSIAAAATAQMLNCSFPLPFKEKKKNKKKEKKESICGFTVYMLLGLWGEMGGGEGKVKVKSYTTKERIKL